MNQNEVGRRERIAEQGRPDLKKTLHKAVARARIRCTHPLPWTFSYDSRDVGGKSHSPQTKQETMNIARLVPEQRVGKTCLYNSVDYYPDLYPCYYSYSYYYLGSWIQDRGYFGLFLKDESCQRSGTCGDGPCMAG